jgi:delta 1-pyrroline-5-carboxylate dehydrogenase
MNWHIERPFLDIVQTSIPTSPFKQKVEDYLLHLWVDEQYDFHLFRNSKIYTIYDTELDIMECKKKQLEADQKKEEENFKKLLNKLKEQGTASKESASEKEEEAEEEEDKGSKDFNANQKQKKGKGSQPSRRTLAKNEKHKAMLVKGIKTSLATSQENLIEIQEELEMLQKKSEAYCMFQHADRLMQKDMRDLVKSYEETHDRNNLIQGLEKIVAEHDKLMRRAVPTENCSGEHKGLCNTHYLPLRVTKYNNSGYPEEVKCRLAPL